MSLRKWLEMLWSVATSRCSRSSDDVRGDRFPGFSRLPRLWSCTQHSLATVRAGARLRTHLVAERILRRAWNFRVGRGQPGNGTHCLGAWWLDPALPGRAES